MNAKNLFRLISSLFICHMAGVIGSIFVVPNIPWLDSLRRPGFAPPNWVITPVWLMLFTLMGFSLYLILNKRSEDKGTRVALGIFGVQLVINTSWNYFFFGLRSLLSGLIVIIVMWVTIAITIAAFFRVSKKAGALLLPYLLWVSVAALINYYLWILNPA